MSRTALCDVLISATLERLPVPFYIPFLPSLIRNSSGVMYSITRPWMITLSGPLMLISLPKLWLVLPFFKIDISNPLFPIHRLYSVNLILGSGQVMPGSTFRQSTTSLALSEFSPVLLRRSWHTIGTTRKTKPIFCWEYVSFIVKICTYFFYQLSQLLTKSKKYFRFIDHHGES